MPTVHLRGIALHYERMGQGRPLMLLPGLASDSASWPGLAEALAERFTVILPDNRGAGRTDRCGHPVSVEEMAEDAMALAEHLELGSVDLLGHSMGGFVAMACAQAHPERVRRLVLEATAARLAPERLAAFRGLAKAWAGGQEDRDFYAEIFRWIFSPAFLADPGAVEAALAWSLAYPYAPSPETFRLQVEALAAFDARSWAGGLGRPALVITGEADRVFPLEESLDLARILPDARHAQVPGTAHAVHSEAPLAVAELVKAFLEA